MKELRVKSSWFLQCNLWTKTICLILFSFIPLQWSEATPSPFFFFCMVDLSYHLWDSIRKKQEHRLYYCLLKVIKGVLVTFVQCGSQKADFLACLYRASKWQVLSNLSTEDTDRSGNSILDLTFVLSKISLSVSGYHNSVFWSYSFSLVSFTQP